MQERLNIAVFVDYDNIEIGLKSTLRREFDVSFALAALKERGDLVAKFAYANWGRQEAAARQMAENAVQMVQRLPSPRATRRSLESPRDSRIAGSGIVFEDMGDHQLKGVPDRRRLHCASR